jgi:hypothetical protein
MLGSVDEPDGRPVQVVASYRIPAFDAAKRNVAGMAQESSKAFSARSDLSPTAPVIMIHVDELPVLKRLVAHATVVFLRIQQAVELLLSQRRS